MSDTEIDTATPSDEEPTPTPSRNRRPRRPGEPHLPGVTEKRTRRRRRDDEPPAVRRIIGGDDEVVAPAAAPAAVPARVPSPLPGNEPENLGESRSGALWTEWDYQRIEWAIRAGRSRERTGALVGRTANAVESRMAAVLAAAGHGDGPPTFGKLFDLDAAGRLDLVEIAAAYHHAEGMPLWGERVDGVLAAAWDEHAPSLTVLADTLELPEWRIVRRLMELDLATDTREAVDHLGTDNPRGVIAVRARMASDAASTVVSVLTITGDDGRMLHVSLHSTDEAATQALTEFAIDADTSDYEPAEGDEPIPALARWAISARRVGEGSVRATRTGRFIDGAVVVDHDQDEEENTSVTPRVTPTQTPSSAVGRRTDSDPQEAPACP